MAETRIHPSAVIAEGAEIGQDVQIGPFCVIGPQVRLGDGVELKSHVVIAGDTSVGAGTVIYPFASIGHDPQDLNSAARITGWRSARATASANMSPCSPAPRAAAA